MSPHLSILSPNPIAASAAKRLRLLQNTYRSLLVLQNDYEAA
jgi:hypothetical protein